MYANYPNYIILLPKLYYTKLVKIEIKFNYKIINILLAVICAKIVDFESLFLPFQGQAAVDADYQEAAER